MLCQEGHLVQKLCQIKYVDPSAVVKPRGMRKQLKDDTLVKLKLLFGFKVM